MNYGLGLIFIAGLLSFLSPCVISLLPAYLGVVSYGEKEVSSKKEMVLSGLFFICGFTIIFLLLGLSTSLLGNIFFLIKPWIARVGGVIIFLFGLQLTGWVNISIINYEFNLSAIPKEKERWISAFFMGIFFSAGWSPCIGPILGSVLTALIISEVSVFDGFISLLVYSLGLGIPFILTAIGFQKIYAFLKNAKMSLNVIQKILGILLCISGICLTFGVFSELSKFTSIFSI